jgi:Ca2+-binding EF-hand superfamily protein
MASTAHTVENACRAVRADLDARQEDLRTLRARCERAFAYCDDRDHRADAEALEVWCGAVGVTLDSTLAAKARIAPLLEAAATLRILRGQPQERGVSFDELAELILVTEARDVEPLVQRARAFFAEKCDDGQAVIAWFRAKGCGDEVTRTDASACLLDLEELPMSSLGALILAERLDINRDGIIDEKDALAWLIVPRKHDELREQLQRWCVASHQSQPKVCFDALDRRGRGLASRRDLEKVLCGKKFFEKAFTRTELDVVLSHLDADGSGCVDVQEFTSWLSRGRSDLVEEEEVTQGEEDSTSLFQAAAQQLRAALLERCGLTGGIGSADDYGRAQEALSNEFRKVDTDNSGFVDESEFAALIASIVDVVDADQLSVGETDVMVSVECTERTWEGIGCEVLEACEGLRSLSLKSSRVEGLRAGDMIKSICGQSVNEMAATLDAEFVEQHPLDALTKRAQFALQTGPMVSLVVSRKSLYKLAKRHVAALWRAVDADASGSVDLCEVERFVLDDAPEAGEHEFAVVLEALREAARKTFDPSDPIPPVAQAFRSVARLTERPFTGDSPHSLPSHTLGVWARQVSNCSRRQGTLFQERLDRNCDGVVSRSEFGAWLYPTRPRDKLKELICDVVDKQYQGKLAKLWARMLPQHPNGSIQREHLQSKLRQAGLGYVGPGEVDGILEATGDKKALRFFRLCAFCGREPERLPPPSPVKRRKKRVSMPRPATAPPRIQRKAVKPPPPPPDDTINDSDADVDAQMDRTALTALQARFRAAPCRGTLDALRSRDAAVLELEEAYAREAALKVDVAHARALVRKAVAAALRKAEAERAEVLSPRPVYPVPQHVSR